MRKHKFKNPHFLKKITFFFLFLTSWPVVSVYSSVLPRDQHFNLSLQKFIENLMVFMPQVEFYLIMKAQEEERHLLLEKSQCFSQNI